MKRLLIYTALTLLTLPLSAQHRLQVSAGTQVSQQQLGWSIAGNLNGINPNVLSELKWHDVQSAGYEVRVDWNVWKGFFLDGRVASGEVLSGRATDVDYSANDRKNQVFYARENADKGHFRRYDLSFGYGKQFGQKLEIAMALGYGHRLQKLYLINYSENLNSTYQPNWKGWLASLSLDWQVKANLHVRFLGQYDQFNYRATANWNLIEDFEHPVSFSHRAKGFGIRKEFSLMYNISSKLGVYCAARWEIVSTGKGIDTLYRVDGSRPQTRLNEVKANSCGLGLGLNYKIGILR